MFRSAVELAASLGKASEMPKDMTVIDLRNAIEKIYNRVLQERGGEATNEQILAEVRTRHVDDIRLLSAKLIDSTLTKLLNDVSRRRGARAINADGPDLFGAYPGILRTIALARGKKKDVAKTTFHELEMHVQARDKRSHDRNKELRSLLEDCRDYVRSADDTIEILVRRKNVRESSARRRASSN